jgi:hypothetical protein
MSSINGWYLLLETTLNKSILPSANLTVNTLAYRLADKMNMTIRWMTHTPPITLMAFH